jgi:hypothetical protein
MLECIKVTREVKEKQSLEAHKEPRRESRIHSQTLYVSVGARFSVRGGMPFEAPATVNDVVDVLFHHIAKNR